MRTLVGPGTALLVAACGAATPLSMGGDAGEPCVPADGGEWSLGIVEHVGAGGWGTALALDAEGTPRVAYDAAVMAGSDAWRLRHAVQDAGTWTRETILTGIPLVLPSVAIDASGASHVAFHGNGDVMQVGYATDAGGAWTFAILDPEGGGMGAEIAIGPGGEVHVVWVHFVRVGAELRHGVLRDGAWSIDVLDGWEGLHWGSSVAVAPSGAVHVVYARNGALVHGTIEAGKWRSEIVDEIDWEFGRGYQCPSLVMDGDDAHFVVQRLDGEPDVVYATNRSGVWRMEAVDEGEGSVARGWGSDLALDAEGAAHVSYVVAGSGAGTALWYATNAGGTWRTEAVDLIEGYAYECEITSIAIDASGRAHVAYSDPEARTQLHATHSRPGGDCGDGGAR